MTAEATAAKNGLVRSPSSTPMSSVRWPDRIARMLRATSLRRYPVAAIAASTRARVSRLTRPSPLTTRDTVFMPTPANCATWLIVGLAMHRLLSVAPHDTAGDYAGAARVAAGTQHAVTGCRRAARPLGGRRSAVQALPGR